MDIILRATVMFFVMYLLLRLLGKRELSQVTPFELVLLIVMGGLLAAVSYRNWERVERAMRTGAPLPRSTVPRLVASVITLAAVVALALTVVDLVG